MIWTMQIYIHLITVREQGRCFYAYEAQNDDELSLAINDIVQIISKNCDDEGLVFLI